MIEFDEEHIQQQSYKIIAVDNKEEVINSLSVELNKNGYNFTGVTDPVEALNLIRNEHYDLFLFNSLIFSHNGVQVIEDIRKSNKEPYILLLTEHKESNLSLDTIKKLNIQGYYEKEQGINQLLWLIESGIKSINQMRKIQKMNDELTDAKKQLEKAYWESIETLRYTVEAKDPYTRGHSDRVSEFAVLIGKKMGLSKTQLRTLRIGGLFHDIGKIGIPDRILLKDGKLSEDEYLEIKNHPLIGERILSNATIFEDIIPIVKYHHERYDGKGYPENLAGTQIPLMARIIAVADSFDAMSSRRMYRENLELDVIIDEIRKNKGTQFDPEIAEIFLQIVESDEESIRKIKEKY